MTFVPPKEELAPEIGALYKYVPIDSSELLDRAISMIKDRSLWFWHVTDQNDENECKPKVFFGGDFRAKYKYFKNDLREAFPNKPSRYLKEQARKAARKPAIPKAHMVYDFWAICCFTTKGNSPELWNEYARNGEGVVIEYEAKEGSSMGMAGKVKYSNKRVKLDIVKINEEICYKIFTTKTKDWEYEEEYRMVERLHKPKSGKNLYFDDIKILSVRLGVELNNEYAKVIEQLCIENNISIYK